MSDKSIRWCVWEKTMNLRFEGGQLMQQHKRSGRKKVGSVAQYIMHYQTKWVKVSE